MHVSRSLIVMLIGLLAINCIGAQEVKKSGVDALGDPLPSQALHRFGTSRFCMHAEATSLVMSQDGNLLAASDRQGRVYLWETATGTPRFITPTGTGKRVAISPDGQWLALGEDAPFEVRNLKKDGPARLPLGNAPRVFAFSPDSKSIALVQTDEADIVVFEIESGKELRRFAGPEGIVGAIAFSPDGKLFAAATLPAPDAEAPMVKVAIFDARKGVKQKEWEHAAKQVKQIAFLADNRTLIGLFASRLDAWDARTGERNNKIVHLAGASFALDTAGKRLASTDGPRVVDFASDKVVHKFDSPNLLRHVVLSGDGKLLAAAPARFDTATPRVLLWDLATGKERVVTEGHRHHVDAVAFSHDGARIATASNVEGIAKVWHIKGSKLEHTLNINSLAAKKSGGPRSRRTLADGLAFAADRPELFVGGQRWDLVKGEPIPLEGDDDFKFDQTNSTRAVISPDARIAASFLIGQGILFWDPAKAQAIKTIEPDKKSQGDWHAFAFAPNRKFAAAGRWFPPIVPEGVEMPVEPTVHLWDITAGKRTKSLRASATPVVRLMFSPDGETLAVIGFPNRLELWHLPTGRLLREMYLSDIDETQRSYVLPTVAFSPHGQWIAFTHQEGEILLIETMTGKEIQTLRGHQGYVASLAFAPDNRRLLSGGRDTTSILWSVMAENPPLPNDWQDADKLWLTLGTAPDQAYRVVWALMANPKRAIEVLSKRLEPDAGASEKEIRELIANLASPKFAKRDPAIRRLKEIGTRALPALEDALKGSPDLETTRRINELLRTVETSLTPEMLRDLRGLQILEMLGTPDARKLLMHVASGDAGAAKTRHAQAALTRLAH
jgi:WD40 repeat protein